MKVLILDNYDSFTFNLYQLVGDILTARGGGSVEVIRNDVADLATIMAKKYDRIIISPGPGDPSDDKYFGVCSQVIRELGPTTPLFGVCLGMQGIGYCFGGKVVRAPVPKHGKTSVIKHSGSGLFAELPQELEVMRYHSLIVDRESLPDCFEVTATAEDSGEELIMALKHREYPIVGVQYHPESFATEGGRKIMENFLSHQLSY